MVVKETSMLPYLSFSAFWLGCSRIMRCSCRKCRSAFNLWRWLHWRQILYWNVETTQSKLTLWSHGRNGNFYAAAGDTRLTVRRRRWIDANARPMDAWHTSEASRSIAAAANEFPPRQLTIAQIPLGSSRQVSTRHDTFDVSSASRRACRAVLFDELDTAKIHGLDTSNESCRDVTWRAEWNLGLCDPAHLLIGRATSQPGFQHYVSVHPYPFPQPFPQFVSALPFRSPFAVFVPWRYQTENRTQSYLA